MTLSVVIPMYNEASIVADTIRTLDGAMQARLSPEEYELIFVSDGSTDDRVSIARGMAGEHPAIRVIEYMPNRGKGCAVRTGMLAAKGDFVLFTDCDLAYGTDVIVEAVLHYRDGVDAVIGSRRLTGDGYEGYTFLRKMASSVYFTVLKIVGGFRLSDSQCGFKSFRGDLARKIFSKCETNGFAFDFEVLLLADKCRAHIEEMPVTIINHRASTVHVVRDSIRMLRDLLRIKKRVRRVNMD